MSYGSSHNVRRLIGNIRLMDPLRIIGPGGAGQGPNANRKRLTGNRLLDHLYLNIIPKRLWNLDTAIGLLVSFD